MKIDEVIQKKIIPLLLEYFNNNTDKVKEIFKGTSYGEIIDYDKKNFSWKLKKEERKTEDSKNDDNKR